MKLVDTQFYWNLSLARRKRRFDHFLDFIKDLPRPVRVLDVGGTESFWEKMQFVDSAQIHVTLLNLEPQTPSAPNFSVITADGTNAASLKDRQFDVVFSNSVIEHCLDWDCQTKMAREIQRLGQRYWVQTPNFWFPIEPHFLFPCFHWLPAIVRAGFLHFIGLGYFKRREHFPDALSLAKSIHLLSAKQLQDLFPGGTLWRERSMGLTKSLVVYGRS